MQAFPKLRLPDPNQHVFSSPAEARALIEAWCVDCSTIRPHGRLGRLPPALCAARFDPPARQLPGGIFDAAVATSAPFEDKRATSSPCSEMSRRVHVTTAIRLARA